MAMNREQKRMLQRQGELGEDGEPVGSRSPGGARPRPSRKTKEQRTKVTQFVREMRQEMRKVAWPTRAETINYSVFVFVTLIVLTTAIALVDYGMSKAVLWTFK